MENKTINFGTVKKIQTVCAYCKVHNNGECPIESCLVWQKLESQEQALAEAKREGVMELIEKLDKQKGCCEECSLWHSKICDANKDCILAIAVGVIKKVEEI